MEQKQIIKIGLTIILGIVLVYLINLYYNNQTKSIETFDDTEVNDEDVMIMVLIMVCLIV